MKRAFDIIISLIGIIVLMPIILPSMFLIWRQDGCSPFYIPERVGKNGLIFRMVKLRSMIINADTTGVDSTSSSDRRITKIGHFIRKFKLDELTQLVNVLVGEMSLVGPRPNIKRETDLYTNHEKLLLTIKPGITDIASIVFSDEGEILRDTDDPDIAYHQLIRPRKNLLGIFYVENNNFLMDIKLIILTLIAIISKEYALLKLNGVLTGMGAPSDICQIALRKTGLSPMAPPGATEIVTSRNNSNL